MHLFFSANNSWSKISDIALIKSQLERISVKRESAGYNSPTDPNPKLVPNFINSFGSTLFIASVSGAGTGNISLASEGLSSGTSIHPKAGCLYLYNPHGSK